MYISRIVIRNFRNFELLDARLCAGVTCVVGDNNTGKSNLLHAIRLACDINLPNYYRELTEQDFHCGIDISTPQHALVSVEFTDFAENEYEDALAANWLVEDDTVARLTYRFRPKASIRQEIEQGYHSGEELSVEDYEWEWIGGGGTDPAAADWDQDVGSNFKWSDLQSYQVVFLHALRDVVAELKQSRSSPLARLLRVLEPTEAEKSELVKILKDANSEIAKHDLLKRLATIVEQAYNKAAGEAHALEIEVGLAAPSFASIERALTLLLSTEFVEHFDPIRNGLGLNNVLFLAMVLEYFDRRHQKRKSAGQLLLIEEPEAHLHPQLQRVLYDALAERNVQTIITTHSSHLTSHAKLGTFLILVNTGEPAISCCTIAERAGLSAGDIADLERFLDATRSTLLFARKVILVEGPAELYLLPIFAKRILGLDLDRLGIAVVAIHGTHFEAYSKLLGPSGLQMPCAIVTDGDPDELFGKRSVDHLENSFVKVFQCETTFERELTISGMLDALSQAVAECKSPQIAKKLAEAEEKPPSDLSELSQSVLNVADRVGKARFAQILCRYASVMRDAPDYIKEALAWITD